MNAERGHRRWIRALRGAVALILCCALLGACAGQGIKVTPRGQTVLSVGAGSR